MKFGLMTQLQMPRPWEPGAERDAFHNAIAPAEAGEVRGFDLAPIVESASAALGSAARVTRLAIAGPQAAPHGDMGLLQSLC